MLIFQKLVDETKMPKPQEYTNTFILAKKFFQLASEVFKVDQIRSKDTVGQKFVNFFVGKKKYSEII